MSPIHRADEHGADKDEAARRGPRARLVRRWLPRAAMASALVLLTAGCNSTTVEHLGLRNPLTTQAKLVVSLWQGSWIAAIAVGAVVWGGILWAVVVYRKRGDQIPHQVRYNLPIEILYTVVPFIMVGVLFYFTARDENKIDSIVGAPGRRRERDRLPVELGVPVPEYPVKNSAAGVTEVGDMWNGGSGRPATRTSCRCWRSPTTRPSVQPHVARRHPLVLGPAVRVQEGRHPRPPEPLPGDADASCTAVPTPSGAARSCAGCTTAGCCSGQDRDSGPVQGLDHRAAEAAERLWGCSVTTFDQPARPGRWLAVR